MARMGAGLILVSALLLCSSVSVRGSPKASGARDLAEVTKCLIADGRFTTFLRLFKQSGFSTIVARYIQTQPVTLLVFTDKAYKKLSARISSQLRGAKLVKLVEYHMLLQKYPADYLRYVQDTALFDTVLGDYLYKQPSQDTKKLILSPKRKGVMSSNAVIVSENTCGLGHATLIVQAIDTVLVPDSLFSTSTH